MSAGRQTSSAAIEQNGALCAAPWRAVPCRWDEQRTLLSDKVETLVNMGFEQRQVRGLLSRMLVPCVETGGG